MVGQIRAAGLRRQHPGETLETSEKENNTNQNNTLAKGVSQDKNANKKMSYCSFGEETSL